MKAAFLNQQGGPEVLKYGDLPEPEAFLRSTLGPDAPEPLKFATAAAETRAVGIGLVLVSPALQRR